MKKITGICLLFFAFGYITNDLLSESDLSIVSSASAEVAGMDLYDLKSDYDFKRAVQRIIEDCSVDGEGIYC